MSHHPDKGAKSNHGSLRESRDNQYFIQIKQEPSPDAQAEYNGKW